MAFVLQLASGKERKRKEESGDGKHKGDGELQNAMQCQKESEIFCLTKSRISEV